MTKFSVVVKGKTVSVAECDVGERKGKEALEFATANIAGLPEGATLRKKHAKEGAGRPKGSVQKAPKKPRTTATPAAAAATTGIAAAFMLCKAYFARKFGTA